MKKTYLNANGAEGEEGKWEGDTAASSADLTSNLTSNLSAAPALCGNSWSFNKRLGSVKLRPSSSFGRNKGETTEKASWPMS